MVVVLKKGRSKEILMFLKRKAKSKKGVNTKKYCGTIRLKRDALLIQKDLRNEWR
jgi:hypothetical protein